MEIVEVIFMCLLGGNISTREDRRALNRLSFVCRAWRSICSRELRKYLTIRSSTDVTYISPTLWRSQVYSLITEENPDDSWIDCFLNSAIPSEMPVASWTCVNYNTPYPRYPSSVNSALRIRLGQGFLSLLSLTLLGCEFTRWVRFASFIAAFPQLEELCVRNLSWEDKGAVPWPPLTWLTLQRRLRRLDMYETSSLDDDIRCELLWLFVVGKPRRPSTDKKPDSSAYNPEEPMALASQDIVVVAQMVSSLTKLCHFNSIVQSQPVYGKQVVLSVIRLR